MKPMTMAKDNEQDSEKTRLWQGAGVMVTLGMLFGFAASLWFGTPHLSKTEVERESVDNHSRQIPLVIVPAESAPVKQVTNDPTEVEKLKTRNRRLEAMVRALQERNQAGKLDLRPEQEPK